MKNTDENSEKTHVIIGTIIGAAYYVIKMFPILQQMFEGKFPIIWYPDFLVLMLSVFGSALLLGTFISFIFWKFDGISIPVGILACFTVIYFTVYPVLSIMASGSYEITTELILKKIIIPLLYAVSAGMLFTFLAWRFIDLREFGDTKLSKAARIKLLFMHIGLICALVLVLFPVIWVLAASFKQGSSLFSSELFPKSFTFDNYYKLFTETKFWLWMRNTVIVCSFSTVLSLIVTVSAGYAFARMEFFGRKWGLMTMIIIQMFPAAMAMVAIYKLLLITGKLTGGFIGLNTLPGLILVYAGGGIPFNTWIIKGYLDGLPKELEESAYMDGATKTQTFLKIVLPLMMPILAVVTIFNFIGPYADFLFPSIVMTGDDKFTLAVGMRAFITGTFSTKWTQFAAASIIGAFPIIVIFFGFQKFLVEGLTKGALKG